MKNALKDTRLFWIIFGVGSILLRMILKGMPDLVESVYSRGIFRIVRLFSDWTVGNLPIPFLYLLIIILPVWGIWKLIRNIKKAESKGAKVFQVLYSLFAFAAGVVGLFLWLWGFNYLRVPIETQLGINPTPLSTTELKEELDVFTEKITKERFLILNAANNSLTDAFVPDNLEKEIQNNITATFQMMGYPTSNRLPVRKLLKGSLLRIGTAGFYLPFTGECNIDQGLHPIQKPHVLAHEMAHGLGIGDEGSCNFIAYLSCMKSNNAFVRYSGYLSLWRTLAVNYRRQAPDAYAVYREQLPEGIIADLDAINQNSRNYPDIFPDLRDKTYDAFLKTQGIEEGMKNYSRVIVLERAWRLQR